MRTYIIAFTIAGFTLISCEPKNIEELNAKIKTLQQDKVKIENEINKFKKELASIDTSTIEKNLPVVTLSKIERSTLNLNVEVYGQVKSGNNVTVIPESNGVIKNISARKGQRVKKGQVLAKLDANIQSNQLAELKNSLELATTLFNKQKNLKEQNVGTEVAYLQAKNKKASLEKSISTLNAQIAKSVITAPISGLIDQIYPNKGEFASIQSPFCRIVNTRKGAYIESEISEFYYRNLNVGNKIEVAFPDLQGEKENIAVSFKSSYIDPANRTFKIQASLPDGKNYPTNLLGTVNFTSETYKDVIIVNTDCIIKEGGENYVFLYKREKDLDYVVKTKIDIEKQSGKKAVVKKGLKSGDLYVKVGDFTKLAAQGESMEVKISKN